MADLIYKQTLNATLAKAPATPGGSINQKFFEVSDTIDDSSNYNECSSSKFAIAPAVTDQVVGMGTVQTGKLLVLKPSLDLTAKITNANGETQNLVFKANKTTIMHLDFTALKFSNPGTVEVKGDLLIAGD